MWGSAVSDPSGPGASSMSGRRSNTAPTTTRISIRARCIPRHMWGPEAKASSSPYSMPSSIAVDIARLWAPDNLKKVAAGTAVCAAIAAVAYIADTSGWTHFGNVFVPPERDGVFRPIE